MDQAILDFLSKERVGALSVQLPDGSLHSAAMHFSHTVDPFELYFSTDSESRKGGSFGKDVIKASYVIGFSETEWKTLQLSGELRVVSDPDEIAKIKEVHYAKNPSSKRFEDVPTTRFMIFTPSWWRYTDFGAKPVVKIEKK